jgi:hypothetical protein
VDHRLSRRTRLMRVNRELTITLEAVSLSGRIREDLLLVGAKLLSLFCQKKENEREKLFQVKRKKCLQKEFARADIVRDVRFVRLPGTWSIRRSCPCLVCFPIDCDLCIG